MRQREAGHFLAARQARQVVVLLFLGAVVVEQFGGTEGVGHGGGGGQQARAAGELHQHAGMRIRGELQAAVFLRDDHREEALALEEVPHLGRQVAALVGDVPVVVHAAQLFAGTVDEGLLLGGELRRLGG